MTPAERLKEIEILRKRRDTFIGDDNVKWLIARVKRLTEALEYISGVCDPDYRSEYLDRLVDIARKALEEE